MHNKYFTLTFCAFQYWDEETVTDLLTKVHYNNVLFFCLNKAHNFFDITWLYFIYDRVWQRIDKRYRHTFD